MTEIKGDWLTKDATQRVMGVLNDAGYEAYFVGGCVRNALLDAPVDDIDISTNAHPDTVMTLAKSAGLKAIPTGIDHGTVTVVADGIPHEITTYRADVQTDGRRAVVRFAKEMRDDAIRRDFTMNALYADRNGVVADPLGGLPDLHARLVRFIQDPDKRIKEDFLRILRFFRFSAWYADPLNGFDPDALDAIAQNLDGLGSLSRERVGSEIMKLMRAADPVAAIAVMQQTGVLPTVLPGATSRALGPMVHLETQLHIDVDPLRRLAAIGVFDGASLRLSKAHQRQLDQYQRLISSGDGPATLGFRVGFDMAQEVLLLRAAMLEMPFDPSCLDMIRTGAEAKFPLSAKDLMPAYTGAALGAKLHALETLWIESGFTLTREALLSDL